MCSTADLSVLCVQWTSHGHSPACSTATAGLWPSSRPSCASHRPATPSVAPCVPVLSCSSSAALAAHQALSSCRVEAQCTCNCRGCKQVGCFLHCLCKQSPAVQRSRIAVQKASKESDLNQAACARSWWLCGGSADASQLTIQSGASVLLDVSIPGGASTSLAVGAVPPVASLWLDSATQCYGGTTLLPSAPGAAFNSHLTRTAVCPAAVGFRPPCGFAADDSSHAVLRRHQATAQRARCHLHLPLPQTSL